MKFFLKNPLSRNERWKRCRLKKERENVNFCERGEGEKERGGEGEKERRREGEKGGRR